MIDLKIDKRLEGFCGPTALKAILDYYGINKSQEEINKFSGASKENGSEPWDLLHAAFIFGLAGKYIVDCTMDRLKEFSARGQLVIVGYQRSWGGHYSVVVGFEDGKVFLADPAEAKIISMKEKDFEKSWFEEYDIGGKEFKITREAILIEKRR